MRRSTYDRIMLRRQTAALWNEAERLEGADPKRRVRRLLKLTREGHNDSALYNNLGYAFAEGQGVKRNRLTALAWNRKAWRRGLAVAANNAAIDARLDGRTQLALLWFRRAIGMGDPDAPFHLAKLLLELGGPTAEIQALLRQRITAGPQEWQEWPAEDGEPHPTEDEDYVEASRLLQQLEAAPLA